jgi:hypothetical protein
MINIKDIFTDMTDLQMSNPLEFAKFFLEKIKQYPGRKLGIMGRAQAGTTTSIQYLSTIDSAQLAGKSISVFADFRGVPDTFIGSLSQFEDLQAIVKNQLPTWWPIFEQCGVIPNQEFTASPELTNLMVNKMATDVEESRLMLQWKAALEIWCLRDGRCVDNSSSSDQVEFYELPVLPIDYNQYFEKLVLIDRRANWFTDPAFQEHYEREHVDVSFETNLVNMRDQEFTDYQSQAEWTFDATVLNDGTFDKLKNKLLATVKGLV